MRRDCISFGFEESLFEVLFKPIDLDKSARQQLKIPGEEFHFIALDQDQIAGTMVVVVEFLKSKEIKSIELFSRNTAIDFWSKLGFVEISEWIDHDLFADKNIQFKKMKCIV